MIKWHEVTWYSKLGAAIVLFGALPVLSFHIGKEYEKINQTNNIFIEMSGTQEPLETLIVNNVDQEEISNTLTKTRDLSDSEMTTATSSRGAVFYNHPYIALTPTNEMTSIAPTGPNKTFTKDDAILAARRKGFFKSKYVAAVPDMVRLRPSIETGSGDAWFAEDTDYHASTTMCKTPAGDFSSIIRAIFEMNQLTGQIVITNKCSATLFD